MAVRASRRAKNTPDKRHLCCECKHAGKGFSERVGGGYVLTWCPFKKYAQFLHIPQHCEHFEKRLSNDGKED